MKSIISMAVVFFSATLIVGCSKSDSSSGSTGSSNGDSSSSSTVPSNSDVNVPIVTSESYDLVISSGRGTTNNQDTEHNYKD